MIIPFQHTRVFYEIAKSRQYRYIINEGGTRSSKTWSMLVYLLVRCLTTKGNKTFQVFRKTLASCNRTVLRDFVEVVDTYDLWGFVEWKKSTSQFIVNGNMIEFCGADQAQKLRGAKRWCVWLNEANELSAEDFKQLKVRTESQIFFDYNPTFTDHWIYDMINIEASETDKPLEPDYVMNICKTNNGVFEAGRVKLIQSTYKDNPLLSNEIIQDIEKLKLYDDDDYNVYALGIRSNPSGLMFKRNFYQTFDVMPERRIGVIYCDPNLSLKGKGDTTAIVKMYYAPVDGRFYIDKVVCRSFSNSNDLLNTVLSMYGGDCRFIAFDGNYAQESSWTNNVQNYSMNNGLPFPVIEYKRYRVDDTAKTAQYLWNDRQIFFNANIENDEDGKRFMSQVYQFNGKKNTAKGTHDDAPDALICAINYMYDLNIVIPKGSIEILNNIIRKR